MKKGIIRVLISLVFAVLLAGPSGAQEVERLDRQIKEEEQRIQELERKYEEVLKRKQAIDRKLEGGQGEEEIIKRLPATEALPVEKESDPVVMVSQNDGSVERAGFREMQKAREEKLREEERLRRLNEAEEAKAAKERLRQEELRRSEALKAEKERLREEARRYREALEKKKEQDAREARERKEAKLRKKEEKLSKARARQEEIKAGRERKQQEAERRVMERKFREAQRKSEAQKQEGQARLAEFIKKRQEEAERLSKEPQNILVEPPSAPERRVVPRKAPARVKVEAEGGSGEKAAAVKAETVRQEKVGGLLDRIEKMDTWIQEQLW